MRKELLMPLDFRVRSDCGAVSLLAAIFGEDPDKLKLRFGLPVKLRGRPQRFCESCGSLFSFTSSSQLCSACRTIHLACAECGRLFSRRTKQVIYQFNKKGYQYTFCNRRCLGSYAARHYGFIAHPENAKKGKKRKYDWDQVIALARETGWGARRIGRQLGISSNHVVTILKSAGIVGSPRKYNWDKVIELKKAGWTIPGISKDLKIPYQSVWHILKRSGMSRG